ncbi:MAG: YdeI/OmpD-associated family protein, partial [Candidatus Kariarchaeaceae archaeon]
QDVLWLIYYKKHTVQPSIPYGASVEVAICFGWIDGKIRKIDEDTYMRRFTPRKVKSQWSPTNIKRAEKMMKSKQMMPAGLIHVNAAKKEGQWVTKRKKIPIEIPKDLQELLESDSTALTNFNNFADGYKRDYIRYINDAKREATRQRRLKFVFERSKKNEKPGMM